MGEEKTKSAAAKALTWRCVACGHRAPVEHEAVRPGDVGLCPSCEDGAAVAMTRAMEEGFVESLARGASDLDALDRALAIGGLRTKKKPRTASQNGKRSRAKGAAFERYVASVFAAVYPDAKRCIGQARTAASEGCDVEGTPWWIECKVGDRPDIHGAFKQSRKDRGNKDSRPIAVISQRTREPVRVTLDLDVFAGLLLIVERANSGRREPFLDVAAAMRAEGVKLDGQALIAELEAPEALS